MQIFKEQEFTCALSGRKLRSKRTQLDHIIPKSRGGTDEKSNLQWLTTQVNRMKGSMMQDDFIALCGEIWKHANARKAPHMRNDL